jgi:hypothetical protein
VSINGFHVQVAAARRGWGVVRIEDQVRLGLLISARESTVPLCTM